MAALKLNNCNCAWKFPFVCAQAPEFSLLHVVCDSGVFAIKLTAHSGQVDWRLKKIQQMSSEWSGNQCTAVDKLWCIRKRIRFIKNSFFGNTSACQIWTLEMSRWAKCIFPAMPRTLLEWTHTVLTQTVCETPTRASDMLLEPKPVESRNFRLLLSAFYFIEMFI